jgi:hypothetical protein
LKTDNLKVLFRRKNLQYQNQRKTITLEQQPSENYSFGGAFTLVDGIIGNVKKLGKTWLGFRERCNRNH